MLAIPPPFPIHRFTVADYEAMGDAGVLTEDDKVELLDGWIVCKSSKSPPRAATVSHLQMLLFDLVPAGWLVRSHGAVVTADSVPEPDMTVIRDKPGDYRHRHPTGADVALIVQVADGNPASDRERANIFARANIPYYWIVNLDDRQIEVFSQPTGAGRKRVYLDRSVLRGKASLDVILNSKVVGSLSVREILE